LLPKLAIAAAKHEPSNDDQVWPGRPFEPEERWTSVDAAGAASSLSNPAAELVLLNTSPAPEIDPLYLFACQVEWEQRADATAGWEVISGARNLNHDTRAHARALLERGEQFQPPVPGKQTAHYNERQTSTKEAGMRVPYGLDVIESCMGCKASREGFFCRFSPGVLRSLDGAGYHSVMPSGALLFVEGQTPRGVYVLCSGKVKLSTTSKEGKVLILKQAEAGEVLGLSAAVSGTDYEMTAETSTPCQLDFIGRQDLMALLQHESEVGVHAAQTLSRDFQSAYRDIHDLVLARSSSGKLARLLLSCAPPRSQEADEQRLRSSMTHEEMAQRIGSSRETVTRLLSNLKKKRLIRIEGETLVIRDRTGLEALAV
jgi:CRP/FNR family transcriptional regulator, cyclic AMP receptor protein